MRHPELTRSLVLQSTWTTPDDYLRSLGELRALADRRRSGRAPVPGDFFMWIYTPRAHNDGTVDAFIEEVLAFPHKQSSEELKPFSTPFSCTTPRTACRS